jgi:hypothetical protein
MQFVDVHSCCLGSKIQDEVDQFLFSSYLPWFQVSTAHTEYVGRLHELFEVYATAHNYSILKLSASEQATVFSRVSTPHVPKVSTARSRYRDHVRTTDVIRPIKLDLDIYLEEDVCIGDKDDSGEDIDNEFEALAWWTFNALKYRILSKMAKDILAVPITTVASESSFSAGGRVIDPHWASLKTETVQMLFVWLRLGESNPWSQEKKPLKL